jgi:hypothetical protein
MRRFKSYLLILLALWLPIQAAAAATMPFCCHVPEPVATEAAHCHEQVMATVAVSDIDCDNCQMCHLASAGFLLTAAAPLPPLTLNVLVPKLELASASHIPEPPQQPPRR